MLGSPRKLICIVLLHVFWIGVVLVLNAGNWSPKAKKYKTTEEPAWPLAANRSSFGSRLSGPVLAFIKIDKQEHSTNLFCGDWGKSKIISVAMNHRIGSKWSIVCLERLNELFKLTLKLVVCLLDSLSICGISMGAAGKGMWINYWTLNTFCLSD